MNGALFRTLFLGLFILKFLIKSGLDLVNYYYLKQHAEYIPPELKTLVNTEKLANINSYNVLKIRFRWIYFLFNSFLVFVFLFSPVYTWYTGWIASFHVPYLINGLLFFGFIGVITWGLDLPFNYYYHFRLEAKYDFNKYSLGGWLTDEVKNLTVSLILISIILSLIFGIWGDQFTFSWRDVFFGWGITLLLVIIFMYLIPVLLIPFFYKLKPVEDTELRQKIAGLVQASGFKVRGIFVADESNKSTHANAMFTGIGRNKTIILFDTLINDYTQEEILAILAHEIGHGKKGHVFKLMILTIVELFLFILFASYLLSANFPYQAMGINKILYSGGFFTYILFFDLLAFLVQPFYSSLSRAFEYEADRYAKELVGSGEPLVASFYKFITHELDNLNPHPAFEAFYYSHPTLLKRIKELKRT